LTEPAFDELLRRLVAEGVRFVVVGGLAVGAWGVVRGTKDVDVVIDLEPDNLRRIAGVAVAVGDNVQQGELQSRAREAEILGVKVAVCSFEDLKAMKKAAGRTRDLADLEDLDAVGDQ